MAVETAHCAEILYLVKSSKYNPRSIGTKLKVILYLIFPSLFHDIMTDTIDCESPNVLFIATCKMCPNHIQYGSSAVDIKEKIENFKVHIFS